MSSPAARERYFYRRTNAIEKFCNQYGFSFVKLNRGYQVRIENVVDVYPVNGKWHWLQSGERGEWDNGNDLRRLLLDKLPGGHPSHDDTQHLIWAFLEGDDELKRLYLQDSTVHACFKQGEMAGKNVEQTLVLLVKMLAKEKASYMDAYQKSLQYNTYPTMILPRNDGEVEYYGHTHGIWLYKFLDNVIGWFRSRHGRK